MFLGTGGSESTRDGKEDGLLSSGQRGDCSGLEFPGGIEVVESCVGKLVPDGDSGGDLGCFCGKGNGF